MLFAKFYETLSTFASDTQENSRPASVISKEIGEDRIYTEIFDSCISEKVKWLHLSSLDTTSLLKLFLWKTTGIFGRVHHGWTDDELSTFSGAQCDWSSKKNPLCLQATQYMLHLSRKSACKEFAVSTLKEQNKSPAVHRLIWLNKCRNCILVGDQLPRTWIFNPVDKLGWWSIQPFGAENWLIAATT